MVESRVNPATGKSEWCLVGGNGRVLQWFGTKHPSKGTVTKAENRVEMFKHMKGKRS